MEKILPLIPTKRYFTISEVSDLCAVKPHVLRYWEQEFTQLRPMKRRGNRRYYQRHEVLMVRRIRELLYDQGFTIIGARNKLQELVQTGSGVGQEVEVVPKTAEVRKNNAFLVNDVAPAAKLEHNAPKSIDIGLIGTAQQRLQLMRTELVEIRKLLGPAC